MRAKLFVMKKSADTGARPPKIRFTVQLPMDVVEAARNAAYWTPGASLNGLVELGLKAEVARMEKKRGEPFPKRKGQLKTGPAVRGS